MSKEAVDEQIGRVQTNIISPHGVLFEGEADFLELPGQQGVLGILPGHMKLISLLRKGEILVRIKGKEDHRIAIDHGFVQVNRDAVEIIVTLPDEKMVENPV